jgi:hypothetical protein
VSMDILVPDDFIFCSVAVVILLISADALIAKFDAN